MQPRALCVDFAGVGPYRATMDLQSAPTEPVITFTAKAVEAVKQVRAREGRPDGHVLRVSVVGGGCSGFSYQLGFDEQPQDTDQVLHLDGVQIAIDPTSAQYLAGTQIDYVSSLHGGGFKFSNPKATHTCGCGSSFSA
jgi:iron-sulfur cluster assembly accessory protein